MKIKTKVILFNRLEDIHLGKLLFALCWMVYAASYLGRYNYSSVMSQMIASGLLTTEHAGYIATAYFVLYGLGQIINGILGQKISPFKMMFTGAVFAGLINIAIPFIKTWHILAILWGINGFAQSMIWPATIKIIAEILPKEQQSKACINISTSVTIGTLVSYALSASCLKFFGWKSAYYIAGALILVIAVIWHRYEKILVQKGLSFSFITEDKADKQVSKAGSLKSMLKNMWISGVIVLILPIMANGLIRDGIITWSPVCFVDLFRITAEYAVVITMVLPITNMVGAYASGLINKVVKNEVVTTLLLFALAAFSFGMIVIYQNESMFILILGFSITSSCMCGINTMLISLVPVKLGKHGNATLYSGVLNSICYFGGAISSVIISTILKEGAWINVFSFWAIVSVISIAFCAFGVIGWKRYCGKTVDTTGQKC